MRLSNMPPGFGSGRDLDHVEGPLTETELDEDCLQCDWSWLTRTTWRASVTTVDCDNCDYHRDEDEPDEDPYFEDEPEDRYLRPSDMPEARSSGPL